MTSIQKTYNELIKFVITSGKRIAKRAGKIEDIGVKKQYLTEEDIAIERGMKSIVLKNHPTHSFFAEEENDMFIKNDDAWIADPISGTKTFIEGLPHYAIVISHMKNNMIQFAAVYNPSVDELFTAYLGKGAFLNGKKIEITENKNKKIMFNLSLTWKDRLEAKIIKERLKNYDVEYNSNSFAINYCYAACGRFDGVIALTKDIFPESAGSLIIHEANGFFTNNKGETNIHHDDRIFIGGNKKSYSELKNIIDEIKFE